MGCHTMDAVTYPQNDVIDEVNAHFVPVRLESGKHPDVARRMNIRWLPGTVVATADERPAHTFVGFLDPADLIAETKFGRAMAAMGEKRYDVANALFQEVAETEGAERAPEAYMWLGISRFRQTKQFLPSVQDAWGKILERWPGSQWARRVGYALGAQAGRT